jgi:hypothetical protein
MRHYTILSTSLNIESSWAVATLDTQSTGMLYSKGAERTGPVHAFEISSVRDWLRAVMWEESHDAMNHCPALRNVGSSTSSAGYTPNVFVALSTCFSRGH